MKEVEPHPYADKFPMLPAGEKAYGSTTSTMTSATVRHSKKYPGYLDVSVWTGDVYTSISRPVAADFVPEVLRVLGAPDTLKWRISDDCSDDFSTVESSVYFIADEDGYIKIGTARSVASRMASLQTASRQTLRLVASIPGDQSDEFALHARFETDRVRGEWFRPGSELMAFIAEVSV